MTRTFDAAAPLCSAKEIFASFWRPRASDSRALGVDGHLSTGPLCIARSLAHHAARSGPRVTATGRGATMLASRAHLALLLVAAFGFASAKILESGVNTDDLIIARYKGYFCAGEVCCPSSRARDMSKSTAQGFYAKAPNVTLWLQKEPNADLSTAHCASALALAALAEPRAQPRRSELARLMPLV